MPPRRIPRRTPAEAQKADATVRARVAPLRFARRRTYAAVSAHAADGDRPGGRAGPAHAVEERVILRGNPMFRRPSGRLGLLAVLFLLLASPAAFAQPTRTWVSGVGDDVNPCSRTAPCKTFAGAISKTAAGGIINIIDPGTFGAVTITKSITIDAVGLTAGILASGTNGIVVNAGASDVVILRGLQINGNGTGLNGIRFLNGRQLVVENCDIERFSQNGIEFAPAGHATLEVYRTTITRTGISTVDTGAIRVVPGASGSAALLIDDVRMTDNRFGMRLLGTTQGVVRNTTIGSSAEDGVLAIAASTPIVHVTLDNVAITDALRGIRSVGGNARIRLSRSLVTGNATGLVLEVGGHIATYGDNRVLGNEVDGALPDGTLDQR